MPTPFDWLQLLRSGGQPQAAPLGTPDVSAPLPPADQGHSGPFGAFVSGQARTMGGIGQGTGGGVGLAPGPRYPGGGIGAAPPPMAGQPRPLPGGQLPAPAPPQIPTPIQPPRAPLGSAGGYTPPPAQPGLGAPGDKTFARLGKSKARTK